MIFFSLVELEGEDYRLVKYMYETYFRPRNGEVEDEIVKIFIGPNGDSYGSLCYKFLFDGDPKQYNRGQDVIAGNNDTAIASKIMRNAVNDQINNFKATNTKPGEDYEVDHSSPKFYVLRNLFFDEYGVTAEDICNRRDGSLEQWQRFHRERAKLRWLPTDQNRLNLHD